MREPIKRRTQIGIASLLLLCLALGATAYVNPEGEHLGGAWRLSPDQAACSPEGLRCVEWCERTPNGLGEIPTGELCCVPDSQVDSEDPTCERRVD